MLSTPFRSDSSDGTASRAGADIVWYLHLELNDDGFHFRVSLDALPPLFAPDAGLLVAAKGQCRIDHGVAVAPDCAGLDLGGKAVHGGQILGPDTGTQAVAGVVGGFGDLLEVIESLRHHHGSEDFIAHHTHAWLHIDQHSRIDVVAVGRSAVASERDRRAIAFARLDVTHDAVHLLFRDQRAHVRLRIERRARPPKRRAGGGGRHLLYVYVGHHDHRRFAAELERDAFHRIRGIAVDELAHFRRPGEGDLVDLRMLHQPIAGGMAVAGDHVDDARRKA